MNEIIKYVTNQDPFLVWNGVSLAAGLLTAAGYVGFHYVSDRLRHLRGYHENDSSDDPMEESYKARYRNTSF